MCSFLTTNALLPTRLLGVTLLTDAQAIWMLPTESAYGDWPASGEIDIMESRGNAPSYAPGGCNTMSSTLHWGTRYPHPFLIPPPTPLASFLLVGNLYSLPYHSHPVLLFGWF